MAAAAGAASPVDIIDAPTSVVLVTGGTGLVGRAIAAVMGYKANSPPRPPTGAATVSADDSAEASAVTEPTAASGSGGGSESAFDSSKPYVNERKDGEQWYFASSKDADLRDAEETAALFDRVKPTHVIHLAAFVGGLYRNMRQKVEFFRWNVQMNDNVMEQCRLHGVRKLVSCLSTCIFPDKTTYPIDESMLHLGVPHASNEGYAYAKRMVEVATRLYREEYKSPFVTIIPTNVYGPHDNFNVEDGHVIPGLVHKCHTAKAEGGTFSVWGTGSPLRQFIFSRDLARLMVFAMREYDSADSLILSVGEEDEVSIGDVARHVASAAGYEKGLAFDRSKSDGQHKKTASNGRLKSILASRYPSFAFTPIEEGIKETVEWFAEHFDVARK